jgi:hypothetical protein
LSRTDASSNMSKNFISRGIKLKRIRRVLQSDCESGGSDLTRNHNRQSPLFYGKRAESGAVLGHQRQGGSKLCETTESVRRGQRRTGNDTTLAIARVVSIRVIYWHCPSW